MKTVTINNFSMKIFNGTIGVSLSGGADSAILAYILMKNTENPIHFFTVASKEKHRRTIRHAANVIDKCIELTGKTNVYQHITYVDRQIRESLISWLASHIETNLVDIIYTGTTSIPSKDILKTFKVKLDDNISNRRKFEIEKPLFHFNNKWYDPFINLNKQQIKSIYDYLEVTETLFPVTYSCEDLINSNTHCGNCWWCEERFWAFGRY